MVALNQSSNLIRACFCTRVRPATDGFSDLVGDLKDLNMTAVGDVDILVERWQSQKLIWHILGVDRFCRVAQHSIPKGLDQIYSITFDLDSEVFLPGGRLNATLDSGTPAFLEYREVLLTIIGRLRPIVGIVDFEADLLCGEWESNTFRAWGNYLSSDVLASLVANENMEVESIVDEYVEIPGCGIMTFINPLGYSPNVTKRQIQYWNSIRSSIVARL